MGGWDLEALAFYKIGYASTLGPQILVDINLPSGVEPRSNEDRKEVGSFFNPLILKSDAVG